VPPSFGKPRSKVNQSISVRNSEDDDVHVVAAYLLVIITSPISFAETVITGRHVVLERQRTDYWISADLCRFWRRIISVTFSRMTAVVFVSVTEVKWQ